MGKFVRLGIGILAGAAAGIAIFAFLRKREVLPENKQSFAEAAEESEI
ncbi:MAG: hypothetical protein WA666_09570 [Nitrospirota bacterium]